MPEGHEGVKLTAPKFMKKCRGGIACNELIHHDIWGPNKPVRIVTKTIGFSVLGAVGTIVFIPVGSYYLIKRIREVRENRRLLAQAARNRQWRRQVQRPRSRTVDPFVDVGITSA